MFIDAHSCIHREAISVDAFEEHVSTLHADGDYMLSQEYEVKSFCRSHNWSQFCALCWYETAIQFLHKSEWHCVHFCRLTGDKSNIAAIFAVELAVISW